MKTFETRIMTVEKDERHGLIMDWGARNVFGGMVRHTTFAFVDHETCEVDEFINLGIEVTSEELAEMIAETLANREQAAEERPKGLRCISDDHSHKGLENIILPALYDPDSMKNAGTMIRGVEDGRHEITMFWSARNAFGRMVETETIAYINRETCEIEEIIDLGFD